MNARHAQNAIASRILNQIKFEEKNGPRRERVFKIKVADRLIVDRLKWSWWYQRFGQHSAGCTKYIQRKNTMMYKVNGKYVHGRINMHAPSRMPSKTLR